MSEAHIYFKKSVLEPIPDYKLNIELLKKLEDKCLGLMREKDADYGGSWQTDGVLSVHMNLKRKFDRLHNIFKNGFNTNVDNETVLDTLMDLRNYTSLYIMFLATKDKGILKELEKEV